MRIHGNIIVFIIRLNEGGQTALGPAMLVAITLASKVAGSKVVMCTDGRANMGLGNLENVDDTEQYKIASDFYSKLGVLAKDNGLFILSFILCSFWHYVYHTVYCYLASKHKTAQSTSMIVIISCLKFLR